MDYEAILTEAHEAARKAVAEARDHYDEMAGACGFAWVKVDGTDGLARHCRKVLKQRKSEVNAHRLTTTYGDKGYPTGWQFWNPGDHNGQRVDIKEAGARAFMHALARHGIRADVGSRLD